MLQYIREIVDIYLSYNEQSLERFFQGQNSNEIFEQFINDGQIGHLFIQYQEQSQLFDAQLKNSFIEPGQLFELVKTSPESGLELLDLEGLKNSLQIIYKGKSGSKGPGSAVIKNYLKLNF